MTGNGLRGELLSETFAQDMLATVSGVDPVPAQAARALELWSEARTTAGPATSLRLIADGVVGPLLRLLGLEPVRRDERPTVVRLDGMAGRAMAVPVIVVPWETDLSRAWRDAVLAGIGVDARWCLCSNGTALRICDAQRTWSRAYLEFDFMMLAHSPVAQLALWNTLGREALAEAPPRLDRLAELSAVHAVDVCRALGQGVVAAVHLLVRAFTNPRRPPRTASHAVFEEALTVIYRILFLLFAEGRGLVPIWHPVYRDRYAIGSIVGALLSGRPYRGAWAAVQAISRLAHAGCDVGALKVTAFNGRLFSPAHARAFEQRRLDDGLIAETVLAVSTTPGRSGRVRIHYRDLDVEQLGAVYEQVLDYDPATLARNRDARKSTGTFYTPREVTAHLVRQTLAPLVAGRTAEQILSLRVLDPAMGSGAFLVATLRYLAVAAEEALIAEGAWHAGDVTAEERSALRRRIAQQCLYGVDLNPVAVQLARLSIWLASLAADKPLTFLDHHLVTGNSLVGATLADVFRQPGGTARRTGRAVPLPLFEGHSIEKSLAAAAHARLDLATVPDDSAAIVRGKEKTLASLHSPDSPLGRWTRLLDLWCSGWFLPRDRRVPRGVFGELADMVLSGHCRLPRQTTQALLAHAAAAAERERFLHWPLAFPEVFELPASGFDAVVGNPPWDMVRGDSGSSEMRRQRRATAGSLAAFVREAGIYRVGAHAHVNRYSLFTERALQLMRPGGRLGLVLPAGIASDVGTAPLRRYLFDVAAVDALTGFDNRRGVFPIHRSVRFVLLTATAGTSTNAVSCRFGLLEPDEIERPAPASKPPLLITRRFLQRVSGEEDMGVPDLQDPSDLRVLDDITARVPCLGDAEGWRVRFGRELNATDDRSSLVPRQPVAASDSSDTGAIRATERPVLAGKQISPFRVDADRATHVLAPAAHRRVPRRTRLAYRDVAGAGNRLTLIAAVIPADAATTHTLFCLKTPLSLDAQHVLCAFMNSFVANYLVRMRVNTHVTTALVAKLRVPVLDAREPLFARLAALSRSLAGATAPVEVMDDYVELQALAAAAYRISPDAMRHILQRFPLMPTELRQAVWTRFNNVR